MSTVLSTSKTSKPHAGALGPWWGNYRGGCTLLISSSVNKMLFISSKLLMKISISLNHKRIDLISFY